MTEEFKLRGSVPIAIRTEEEMASIDKESADNFYKEQKKKLDFFMQQRGFVKHKTNSYIRRNDA